MTLFVRIAAEESRVGRVRYLESKTPMLDLMLDLSDEDQDNLA